MWHNAFATKCLHKRKAAADSDRSLLPHVRAARSFSDSDATRPRVNLSVNWEFETLIAPLRFSRESARYTYLIPPAAIGARIS